MNKVNIDVFRNYDYIYQHLEEYRDELYSVLENHNTIYILNLTSVYNVFVNEISNYEFSNYPTDTISLFSFIVDYIIITNERPDSIETEEIAYDIDNFSAFSLVSYTENIIHDFIYEQIDLYDRIRTEVNQILIKNNIYKKDIMVDEWTVVTNDKTDIIEIKLTLLGV